MKAVPSDFMRWMRFNAVGAIGIAVQIAVLALLRTSLGINYLLATAIAVEAAVLHNFFWHERFTWADRSGRRSFARLIKFNLTTGAFSIAGNVIAMRFLVGIAGTEYLVANAISIAACSILNFLVADRIIFPLKSAES